MATNKRRLSVLLGVILSSFFLVLFVKDIEWIALGNALRQAKIEYVAIAGVIHFASLALNALRWQILLSYIAKIRFTVVFSASLIGSTGNCLLPARMGDIIRVWIISRKKTIPFTPTFASVVAEKVADLLSFLLVFVFFSPFLIERLGRFRHEANFLALVAAGIVAALFLMAVIPERWGRLVIRVVYLLPKSLSKPLIDLVDSFLSAFKVVCDWKLFGRAIVVSFAIMLAISLSMYTLFVAFQIKIPFLGALMVLFAVTFAVFLPQAPAFIGVFHWVTKETLELMGVDASLAAAYAVVSWAVYVLPAVLGGLVALSREGLSLGDLRRRAVKESG